MISSRYAPAVAILLAFALIPTVIHSYYGLLEQDGLTSRAVSTSFAGFLSTPTKRHSAWVKDIFDSDDWIERNYLSSGGDDVLLFVARSYDHKRLYHHPELAILYGTDLEDGGIIPLPQAPQIPVHLLRSRGGKGIALYALLYGDQFVGNPVAFQLRTALELVFSPRKPLTLLLTYDRESPADAAVDHAPVAKILADAIESFRTQSPGIP